MRRKTAAILLLFSLTAPLMATYGWLQYKKAKVRREVMHQMVNGMDNEQLVLVKISNHNKKAIKWKEDDEFEFRDEMYDVVKTKRKRDTTYYYCWPDHEETQLNKQLAQLLTHALNQNTQQRKGQQHLIDFFKMLFAHPLPEIAYSGMKTPNVFEVSYHFIVTSFSITPPAPPPKVS